MFYSFITLLEKEFNLRVVLAKGLYNLSLWPLIMYSFLLKKSSQSHFVSSFKLMGSENAADKVSVPSIPLKMKEKIHFNHIFYCIYRKAVIFGIKYFQCPFTYRHQTVISEWELSENLYFYRPPISWFWTGALWMKMCCETLKFWNSACTPPPPPFPPSPSITCLRSTIFRFFHVFNLLIAEFWRKPKSIPYHNTSPKCSKEAIKKKVKFKVEKHGKLSHFFQNK